MTTPAESGSPAPTIRVRAATAADAEGIRNIYNHEVENTTATMDLVTRTLADQVEWLAARSGAFTALVAVRPASAGADPRFVVAGTSAGGGTESDSEEILGFASLSPYKERAAYRPTVEDSVYVRRDLARHGVGRILLEELIDRARSSGFHSMMARIEASGAASRGLHSACGFREVGIEREVGRKFNRWLDVVLMQKML
ncbi:MAG: phosphinothricin N-acetyltransferase [Actinomycetota bacterium]